MLDAKLSDYILVIVRDKSTTSTKSNTTLTTLDLSANSIAPEGAQSLSNALKSNTTLTTLGALNRNANLGSEGAQSLNDALKSNTTLTTLSPEFVAFLDTGSPISFITRSAAERYWARREAVKPGSKSASSWPIEPFHFVLVGEKFCSTSAVSFKGHLVKPGAEKTLISLKFTAVVIPSDVFPGCPEVDILLGLTTLEQYKINVLEYRQNSSANSTTTTQTIQRKND